MIFISDRKYANFEGCKFNLHYFETNDKRKIKKLKNSAFYGKGFKEVTEEEGEKIQEENKPQTYTIEELEQMLAKKKLEEAENVTDNFDSLSYEELKKLAKAEGMEWDKNPKKIELLEYLRG